MFVQSGNLFKKIVVYFFHCARMLKIAALEDHFVFCSSSLVCIFGVTHLL
jgi:hypothetical protein